MVVLPITCALIGIAIPFTPLAHVLGFTALPLEFFLILLGDGRHVPRARRAGQGALLRDPGTPSPGASDARAAPSSSPASSRVTVHVPAETRVGSRGTRSGIRRSRRFAPRGVRKHSGCDERNRRSPMNTVLLATDGSPTAAQALDFAVELCQDTGARLEVLTVRTLAAHGDPEAPRGDHMDLQPVVERIAAEADAARARPGSRGLGTHGVWLPGGDDRRDRQGARRRPGRRRLARSQRPRPRRARQRLARTCLVVVPGTRDCRPERAGTRLHRLRAIGRRGRRTPQTAPVWDPVRSCAI